jgi:hypothetical protein
MSSYYRPAQWLHYLCLPLQEGTHHTLHAPGPIAPGCITLQRIDDLECHHLTLEKLLYNRL